MIKCVEAFEYILTRDLHLVHLAVAGPAAECLTLPPEQDTEKAPEQDQAGVCHDWGNETT